LSVDNEPLFREGWHAQVLAVASNMVESGQFSAVQWTENFAAALKQPYPDAQDELDAYYMAALSTLESLLVGSGSVPDTDIEERTELWRCAYLNTAHGDPVEMSAGLAGRPADHSHHHHEH